MIPGIVASGSGLSSPTPIDVDPWEEVGRVTAVSGGKLTLSGLDLEGAIALRLIIDGVTVTTDSTDMFMRFLISGTEESGDFYQWSLYSFASGTASTPDFNNEIRLTDVGANLGVGNAGTDSFSATITIFDPTSVLHKIGTISNVNYMDGNGNLQGTEGGNVSLDVSGKITGVVLYGSSDLLTGSIIALAVS